VNFLFVQLAPSFLLITARKSHQRPIILDQELPTALRRASVGKGHLGKKQWHTALFGPPTYANVRAPTSV
jgi:hypothetical protein